MKKHDFDLIAIGGGSAGITAVMLARGLGKKPALIDRKKFGGECTWSGCVPSKTLIHEAGILRSAAMSGNTVPDASGVLRTVRETVEHVYENERPEEFEKTGITAIENASVVFRDRHTIEVNGTALRSKYFIITTGSSPLVPPIPGLDQVNYHTNETIFSLPSPPQSMAVLGGGPIGIELAQAFNRLGTHVTVIEIADTILPREDSEMAKLIAEKLAAEGITILTGATVTRAEPGDEAIITCRISGIDHRVSAAAVLVAAGRRPNTDGLSLENAGVAFDRRSITVDRYMRTTAGNIYAAGDVAGPYQFSHVANYQAILAASNALLPFKRKSDYRHVPWCVFTDPELARSGMTEDEARDAFGGRIQVYRAEYGRIDRAKTDCTGAGFAKCICDRRGRILGIHILGERAGEVLHEAHAAKTLGIPLHRLNGVMHVYPTYSEIIKVIARDAYIERIRHSPFVKLAGALRRKR